ncbi:2-amino-4-hydroxy-6-hydroxymethyldihydropteridine diphosphokinase [Gammaproteobacteria bacterium]|nr:2-amino-4-hydroxy-6-hydroxymethyldihydropteridine diphosphokinase [Gammaproteobacteria bacterium]
MKYFLSIGSNVNPKENIDFALDELKLILDSTISSSIHQTPSVGFEGDDFLNLVVSGESESSFDELNKKTKRY